jgi:hypothetical protein
MKGWREQEAPFPPYIAGLTCAQATAGAVLDITKGWIEPQPE